MSDIIIIVPAKIPETSISALREIANTNDIKLVVIADTPEQDVPNQLTTIDFVLHKSHFESVPKQIQKIKKYPRPEPLKTFKTIRSVRQKIFFRTKNK